MFKKVAFGIIVFIFILSGFFVVNLYRNQEHLLFKSKSLEHSFQFSSRYDLEELFFSTEEEGKIHAILYKVDTPKGLVVYFHGQGGNLHNWTECFYDFLKRDYNVLAMDYRSFGKSKGFLNEKNILKDAEIIYQYALDHYAGHNIILYGRSLGTGIATYIASKYPSKLLILETPYFNILDQAKYMFPYVPDFILNFIVKYPLRTDLWIKDVKTPIEIFHGTADEMIPFQAALKLFKLLKNREKTHFTTVENGKHNNLSKYKIYQQRLDALLN